MKCERKFKHPKPGKKGLVKFPRTIIACKVQKYATTTFVDKRLAILF